jgi:acyl-CoA synthetase (AMP-forming)/AMP-acid ligase II
MIEKIRKIQTKYKVSEIPNPAGFNELVYTERPKNLAELLANTVAKNGEFEAIITPDNRLTYNQFASFVNNLCFGLYHQYGIRKGDRISLMLRNGWEFGVLFFALVNIGAIAVPLNTAYKGEEAAFQINDSGSKIVVIEDEFLEIIMGIKPEIRNVEHIIITGKEEFRDLLKNRGHKPFEIQVDEMDSAVIMYTSGTTGRPKGAVLSHRGVIAEAMWICELFDWQAGRDKNLCPVPLFHVTGLVMDFCGAIYAGIPSVFMKKFNALDALKIIEEEKITTMIGVPTILWLMLNHSEFDRYNLTSLRLYGAGGAATPEELIELCLKKLPQLNLCPGYGLTEACGMTLTTTSIHEALSHKGSVGRAIPLMDIKIVDNYGNDLPFGEPGELLIRGCQTLKEYWNNPEATKKTISKGWLHTGDIARIDEEGYVYILDRMKDMINRGGEKIWSLEVENVLYRNPKVLEAAAVGVPDPVFGEEVKAVIVLKQGEKATPEEIQEFCGRYLAKFKIPKYIEFRESLPRNPAGKVIKDRLKH